MGHRARESGWDTNSAFNWSSLNYSSSVNNQFGVQYFGSIQFGEEESSIAVQSPAALGLRRWKTSLVGLVQSEFFSRSLMRSSYWNGYFRCVLGVGQTPKSAEWMMTERHGFITKRTSPNTLSWRGVVGTYQLRGALDGNLSRNWFPYFIFFFSYTLHVILTILQLHTQKLMTSQIRSHRVLNTNI